MGLQADRFGIGGGGACAGFAEGDGIGKTGILDAIGVLRFNDGVRGEDEFCGDDVSGQRTGRRQIGDIAFGTAGSVIGLQAEGFTIGGGGIVGGQSGEGGDSGDGSDAGCDGLGTVAECAGRSFGQGHRLGEVDIGVAGGVLCGDDGLCGQGGTADGPRRRGGKSYGGGGDVECGTGAIGCGGVGSADLGASTRDGQVGIAVYGEDQGLVFAEGRAIGSLTLPDAVSVPSLSLVVKSQVSL